MFLHLFKPLPNPSTQMPSCEKFVWQNLRKGIEFYIQINIAWTRDHKTKSEKQPLKTIKAVIRTRRQKESMFPLESHKNTHTDIVTFKSGFWELEKHWQKDSPRNLGKLFMSKHPQGGLQISNLGLFRSSKPYIHFWNRNYVSHTQQNVLLSFLIVSTYSYNS